MNQKKYVNSFVSQKVTYTLKCKCGKTIETENIDILYKSCTGRKNDKGEYTWHIYSNCYPVTAESVIDVRCPECEEKHINKLFNSDYIIEKINGGYYVEYPNKFMADALSYAGIKDNPKASKVYSKAWDDGHSSGHMEVLNILLDLAEFI